VKDFTFTVVQLSGYVCMCVVYPLEFWGDLVVAGGEIYMDGCMYLFIPLHCLL
jgi:hypothetical protein